MLATAAEFEASYRTTHTGADLLVQRVEIT